MKVAVVILAAVGFLVSAVAHVAAICGIVLGGEWLMFGYFIGIFVVAFPTFRAMHKKYPQRGWKYDWQRVLADCPQAVRILLYAMIAYACLNFVFVLSKGGKTSHDFGWPLSVYTARGFSANAMCFYLACGAIMLSLYRGDRKQ